MVPLVERTFTVLGYMRTIITTNQGKSRVNSGESWEDIGSHCHYAFWADAAGVPQKTRTYVARAGWPPQTWASGAFNDLGAHSAAHAGLRFGWHQSYMCMNVNSNAR